MSVISLRGNILEHTHLYHMLVILSCAQAVAPNIHLDWPIAGLSKFDLVLNLIKVMNARIRISRTVLFLNLYAEPNKRERFHSGTSITTKEVVMV